MKTMKKTLSAILCAAIVVTFISSESASAAKKPSVRKKAVLTVGSSVKIKVKNSAKKAKVKWKTANKKIAKLIRKVKKGKNASAVVKGMKVGTTKVTAIYKAGNKKMKLICKIKVNPNPVQQSFTAQVNTKPPVSSDNSAPTATAPATATNTPSNTPTAAVSKTENQNAYVKTDFTEKTSPVYMAESCFEIKDVGVSVSANGPDEDSRLFDAVAGGYISYKGVNLTNAKVLMMIASADSENAGKNIEIHIDRPDGDTIGELTLIDKSEIRYRKQSTLAEGFTENFNVVFNDHYAELKAIEGIHDLYFVFPEAIKVDVDWFTVSPYGGFEDETEELKDQRMQWWRDAAFGQFIHFGAYSHLAGEVKDDNGNTFVRDGGHGAEWIMLDSGIFKRETYENQAAKLFNPSEFDAEQVVSEAKAAGQKYIVFTSRHHEGLSMYDTKVREFKDYSIMNEETCPEYTKREDIVKNLAEECQKQGIHFGVYTTIMDFHDSSQDFEGRSSALDRNIKLLSDVNEYMTRLKAQMRELMVDYGCEIFFFDGQWVDWWNSEMGNEMTRYMRTINPNVIINNRVGKSTSKDGDYGTPEKTIPATGLSYDWESCMTLNNTWGYNKNDNNWKSASEVISMLVQCASGGGNLLLNIGPKGDGSLPEGSSKVLSEVGIWIDKFGESIYNTEKHCFSKWLSGGVRTTTVLSDKDNPENGKIYIHLGTNNPATLKTVTLPALENSIVSALAWNADGTKKDVIVPTFAAADKTVTINVSNVPKQDYNTVIELTVKGTPKEAEDSEQRGENLAADKTTNQSSSYGSSYTAKEIVDGDVNTRWAADDSNDRTPWAYVDLGESKTFNEIVLSEWYDKNNGKYRCTSFTIEGSDTAEDGSFTELYSGTGIGDNLDILLPKAVTYRYIKINLLGSSVAGKNASIQEMEVYNSSVKTSVSILTDISEVKSLPITLSGTAFGGTDVLVTFQQSFEGKAETVFQKTIKITDGKWSAVVPDTVEIPKNAPIYVEVQLLDEDGSMLKTASAAGVYSIN